MYITLLLCGGHFNYHFNNFIYRDFFLRYFFKKHNNPIYLNYFSFDCCFSDCFSHFLKKTVTFRNYQLLVELVKYYYNIG